MEITDIQRSRAILYGIHIRDHKATIRETAEQFGASKTSVHYTLRAVLPKVDFELYKEVEKVWEHHKKVRHIRGGLASRKKWMEKRIRV